MSAPKPSDAALIHEWAGDSDDLARYAERGLSVCSCGHDASAHTPFSAPGGRSAGCTKCACTATHFHLPGSAETVARGVSADTNIDAEACTDSAHNDPATPRPRRAAMNGLAVIACIVWVVAALFAWASNGGSLLLVPIGWLIWRSR